MMAVVLQAILKSLLHAVSKEFHDVVLKCIGSVFEDVLDYGDVRVDIGQGLVGVGESIGMVADSVSKDAELAGHVVAGVINNTAQAVHQFFFQICLGTLQRLQQVLSQPVLMLQQTPQARP